MPAATVTVRRGVASLVKGAAGRVRGQQALDAARRDAAQRIAVARAALQAAEAAAQERAHLAERELATLRQLDDQGAGPPMRGDRLDQHLQTALFSAGVAGGDVLEIGAEGRSRSSLFDRSRFTYTNTDLRAGPGVLVADITHCPQIADNSYDVIVSFDVFQHIDRPWLAASEITRILRPGGLVYTTTIFSWRYHPDPIDFWRYSPAALQLLFADLECIDAGWDDTERRRNMRAAGRLSELAADAYGGWRENWRVFHVGRKPAAPSPAEARSNGTERPAP